MWCWSSPQEAVLGAIVGVIGGRLVVIALNRVALPQGLHAPFVTTAALVIFGVRADRARLRISSRSISPASSSATGRPARIIRW